MEPHETTDGSPARETRKTAPYKRHAMRMLKDPQQGMVLVYEKEPDGAAEDSPSLVFESGTWCARIDEYPENWRTMPEDQLLDLGARR